ncbi:MAG: ATP-binding protein [Polyangiales bacterium]
MTDAPADAPPAPRPSVMLAELLRDAQHASPIPFALYRADRDESGAIFDFTLVYQNAAAARITGQAAGAAAEGTTLLSLFPGLSGTDSFDRSRAVVEGGEPYQREVAYRDARIEGWFRVSAARPAPEHLALTFEDITAARAAAERERERAHENEVLLRVSGAISGLDLEAIVQSVTDEATQVCHAEFGAFFYNRLSADGESYMLYTLSGVPKSAFEKFPMPRNTAVFGPTFRGEGVVRHDDVTKAETYGKSAPYHGMPPGHLPVRSYLAVPVLSRSGHVLGGLFFGHSQVGVFTQRHERTVVTIAQLAAVAMDNARLFELARRERQIAEEASRMKDDFLATISHELRTPLQSILGWTHMLRSGSLADASRQRALEAVDRNARAQASLIEDILDVSRIIAGKLRIEVAPVHMGDVVQAALETVRPAASARDVRLQAVVDGDAGMVMGDASRLHQVVWNLLSNAVKFSLRGGRVYVHLRRARSAVEVVVADEGQGITADFIPHVFERFRQADSSTTRNTGGLGLGLSIVKHLVELHGGNVTVESPGSGLGATFTLRIPIAPLRSITTDMSQSRVRESAELACPVAVRGLRILVADDEEDARELLRSVLEHCEASVLLAGSGREAFDVLCAERPDVLVTDIGMPDQDGYVLIDRVRALSAEDGGRTPAVALTAYARAEDRTKALARGFNHHVAKPVNPSELLVVIANLAERMLDRPSA